MDFLLWVVVLVAVLALHYRQAYSRFSAYGVKHLRAVPFFGNILRLFFRFENMGSDFDRLYYSFPGERFVGRYEFAKPVLVVRDLELIKNITIKDFEHFLDHRNFTDDVHDPLFARNLISLKGQEWRDMRSTLTPAFTSSKIKVMVPFMEEVSRQMIQELTKKIENSVCGAIDIDCKDLTSRYANDVIASCAFGLKMDSHADENNQFYKKGKTAATFKFKQILVLFVLSACPTIAKRLKLSLVCNETKAFFIDLVTTTIKDRETKNIVRPDIIHLLMEARKGLLTDDTNHLQNDRDARFATVRVQLWSDNDVIAQALLFFIAAFETVSQAMCFALHELAIHPHIQDRLYREIKEHNNKTKGTQNFNTIQDMTYMDMVVSEVMRVWPPALVLDRMCVKDYNIGKPNNEATQDYVIRKGEILSIPLWCFHHDPQFYSNPMKFDPERFSDANKHLIDHTAYMPFGLGPRSCIGSRFALCELKFLVYHILLHCEVSPSEKTCLPAKLSAKSLNAQFVGGHWLKFRLRPQ